MTTKEDTLRDQESQWVAKNLHFIQFQAPVELADHVPVLPGVPVEIDTNHVIEQIIAKASPTKYGVNKERKLPAWAYYEKIRSTFESDYDKRTANASLTFTAKDYQIVPLNGYNILCTGSQNLPVIPRESAHRVLVWAHTEGLFKGTKHRGRDETYNRIKRHFDTEGLSKTVVSAWIKHCSCSQKRSLSTSSNEDSKPSSAEPRAKRPRCTIKNGHSRPPRSSSEVDDLAQFEPADMPDFSSAPTNTDNVQSMPTANVAPTGSFNEPDNVPFAGALSADRSAIQHEDQVSAHPWNSPPGQASLFLNDLSEMSFLDMDWLLDPEDIERSLSMIDSLPPLIGMEEEYNEFFAQFNDNFSWPGQAVDPFGTSTSLDVPEAQQPVVGTFQQGQLEYPPFDAERWSWSNPPS